MQVKENGWRRTEAAATTTGLEKRRGQETNMHDMKQLVADEYLKDI